MPVSPPNPEAAEEDLWIARVQMGVNAAFEPLLDAHLQHLRAFVALKLPASHLVDEIVHEAFVFAFRNIATFEIGTSFRAWLRAIAWNLCRAEIQRFSRERVNQSRYQQVRLIECEEDAGNPYVSREAEYLEECMQSLPETMQKLLTMKYTNGCTSEEIAGVFQRTVEWVRVTLFRVRNQLRECIENKGGENAHAR